MLRLTNFEISNGPDVRVYWVAVADVNENETVNRAGVVGPDTMKWNIGDQNHEGAGRLDLAKYRSETIWCRRFSVNVGKTQLANASGRVGSLRGESKRIRLTGNTQATL